MLTTLNLHKQKYKIQFSAGENFFHRIIYDFSFNFCMHIAREYGKKNNPEAVV